MAFRIPRGYAVNRTPYQELSEGVRPEASTVPMVAWTGLAAVRVDELAHDPIVLDAGTVVGLCTGGSADGTLFPAFVAPSGGFNLVMKHHSDGESWGLPTTDITATAGTLVGGAEVKPLGMVYQPIYSFILQDKFTNYKRNENVGIVTNYMVQIPATNAEERAIRAGDLVQVTKPSLHTASYGQITAGEQSIGTVTAWDGTAAGLDFVIGRCFQNLAFATGTASVNTVLDADVANVSLTTAGAAEFKGLERVQTVPGLGLAGSGTKGTPSWLVKAQADGSGNYKALTILVRL